MTLDGGQLLRKRTKAHLPQVAANPRGEEEPRTLPDTDPLQDFQAVLGRATQQFLNGLWFGDIKTLEEGTIEVLQLPKALHGCLEHGLIALILAATTFTNSN